MSRNGHPGSTRRIRQHRKISRADSELLLRGEPGGPHGSDDPLMNILAGLLAKAAAPARYGDRAGEEAAVAAFHEAGRAGPHSDLTADLTADLKAGPKVGVHVGSLASPQAGLPAGTRRPWGLSPVMSWRGHPVRTALMAVALTTTMGGVAFAAGTAAWSGRPADNRPTSATTSAATTAARPDGTTSTSLGAGGSAASPRPSTAGLCRAYASGAATSRGKALDNPAFESLITAAGGKAKVPTFCASVLADKPGGGQGPPAARPTNSAHMNSGKPRGKADQHQPERPGAHP
jgi:hypothetical protein